MLMLQKLLDRFLGRRASRSSKLSRMVINYSKRCSEVPRASILAFHQDHIFLFVTRFHQFVSHYKTPSSSLLNHDLFLTIEAAVEVAKKDWLETSDRLYDFDPFFDAFEKLRSGEVPIYEGACVCRDWIERSKKNEGS